MTPKCNQTSCDKPIPDFDDICVTCGTRYGKHFGSECPVGKGKFVPLKPTDQPDPEAVRCYDKICRESYNTKPGPDRHFAEVIISRYLQKAREDTKREIIRETQAEVSIRIHECAMEAAKTLYDKGRLNPVHAAPIPQTTTIICEAFGAPAKDECEEAAEAAWEKGENPLDDCTTKAAFKVGFKTAWKLAKGEK